MAEPADSFPPPPPGAPYHDDQANHDVKVSDAQVAQLKGMLTPEHASLVDVQTLRRFVRATGGNLTLVSNRKSGIADGTASWYDLL